MSIYFGLPVTLKIISMIETENDSPDVFIHNIKCLQFFKRKVEYFEDLTVINYLAVFSL